MYLNWLSYDPPADDIWGFLLLVLGFFVVVGGPSLHGIRHRLVTEQAPWRVWFVRVRVLPPVNALEEEISGSIRSMEERGRRVKFENDGVTTLSWVREKEEEEEEEWYCYWRCCRRLVASGSVLGLQLGPRSCKLPTHIGSR